MGELINLLVLILIGLLVFVPPIIFVIACVFSVMLLFKKISLKKKNKKYNNKFLLLSSGLIIFIPLMYIFGNFLFTNYYCISKESSVIKTPNGNFTAQIKNKNCGVTTPFNTWVELKNVNGRRKTIQLQNDAIQLFTIRWIDDRSIEITYKGNFCPDTGKSFIGESSWSGVLISYKDNCSMK